MALICAPLVSTTIEEDIRAANSADCDLVEVRLDYLSDFSNIHLMSRIKKPVIATCMPSWEGGRFKGEEAKRLRILEDALDYVKYVTIELGMERKVRDSIVRKARSKKVKVIISHHDFRKTPKASAIRGIIKKELGAGADIPKVAFKANRREDILELILALSWAKRKTPVIALSMGEKGKAGRVIAPLFGSYLSFAALSKGKESAPGQLTLPEMRKALEILQ